MPSLVPGRGSSFSPHKHHLILVVIWNQRDTKQFIDHQIAWFLQRFEKFWNFLRFHAAFFHIYNENFNEMKIPHVTSTRQLQKDRDQLRAEAHRKGGETSWAAFRDMCNKIKSLVGKARRSFLANALSSKRPKEVWKVIHRVLHPSPKPLCEDPEKLNRYFISTAARTLGTKPDSTHDFRAIQKERQVLNNDMMKACNEHNRTHTKVKGHYQYINGGHFSFDNVLEYLK